MSFLKSHVIITANAREAQLAKEYFENFELSGEKVVFAGTIEPKVARLRSIRTAAGLVALTGFGEEGAHSPDPRVARDIKEALDADVPVVFPFGFPASGPDSALITPEEWSVLGAQELPDDVRTENDPLSHVGAMVTMFEEATEGRS